MKSAYLLFFLTLIFNTPSFGQETGQALKGIVYDKNSKLPVYNVSIEIVGLRGKGSLTDSLGQFEMARINFPTQLYIRHLSYESQIVDIKEENANLIEIFLAPKTTLLPEISVTAARKTDTVFREPINVVDYEFLGENIVLLAYVNVFKKYQLYLLDVNEQVKARISLAGHRPSNLFKSCFGDLYVLTSLGAYRIKVNEASSLSLDKKTNLEEYETLLKPCIIATDSFTYYGKYFYQGQALRYFAVRRNGDPKHFTLPLIEHEHNIDLLIEETGDRFPRSGDVWEAEVEPRLAALRSEPYGLKGMFKIFYPKLFAPLVRYDSLLCLFNHQASEIQFYTEKGDLKSSIPIRYHQHKKWKKRVIYDAADQTAYTFFVTRWGEQICPIDLKNGTLGAAVPIDLAFPEKLKIRDGYLYFLHRDPYRGGRKRMLRKVSLD